MNAIKFNQDGSSEAIELTESEVRKIKARMIKGIIRKYEVRGGYTITVYNDKYFVSGFSNKEIRTIIHNPDMFFVQNNKIVIFDSIKKSPVSLGDFYFYSFPIQDRKFAEKEAKDIIDYFRLRLSQIQFKKRGYYGKDFLDNKRFYYKSKSVIVEE